MDDAAERAWLAGIRAAQAQLDAWCQANPNLPASIECGRCGGRMFTRWRTGGLIVKASCETCHLVVDVHSHAVWRATKPGSPGPSH